MKDARNIHSFINYYLHLKSYPLIQDIPTNLMMVESIILYLWITVHVRCMLIAVCWFYVKVISLVVLEAKLKSKQTFTCWCLPNVRLTSSYLRNGVQTWKRVQGGINVTSELCSAVVMYIALYRYEVTYVGTRESAWKLCRYPLDKSWNTQLWEISAVCTSLTLTESKSFNINS